MSKYGRRMGRLKLLGEAAGKAAAETTGVQNKNSKILARRNQEDKRRVVEPGFRGEMVEYTLPNG